MKSSTELIKYAAEKGIKFEVCNKKDAEDFIKNKNNYFKITSYRKNFQKYQKGNNTGKYIGLDFQHLIDMSIIDTSLRHVVLHMCLDIEHFLKISILNVIKKNNDNEYGIVKEYIESLTENSRLLLENELKRNENNVYTKGVYKKYTNHYPVWAFIEIISFGSLLFFYKFLAEKYQLKYMTSNLYMLYKCKSIRNASAHNNCVLNDLNVYKKTKSNDFIINRLISKNFSMSKKVRRKRLSNERVCDLLSMLFLYKEIVKSVNSINYTKKRLEKFISCIEEHESLFVQNKLLTETFDFIKKFIKLLYFI